MRFEAVLSPLVQIIILVDFATKIKVKEILKLRLTIIVLRLLIEKRIFLFLLILAQKLLLLIRLNLCCGSRTIKNKFKIIVLATIHILLITVVNLREISHLLLIYPVILALLLII